jgi:hypothetical protein
MEVLFLVLAFIMMAVIALRLPIRLGRGEAVVSTNPTEPTPGTTLYQKTLGVIIWAAFAALGIGLLYWFSILSGD